MAVHEVWVDCAKTGCTRRYATPSYAAEERCPGHRPTVQREPIAIPLTDLRAELGEDEVYGAMLALRIHAGYLADGRKGVTESEAEAIRTRYALIEKGA